MSNLVNGLMEAYTAVYDEDLREELKEEREVEEVGIQIIENAAYVLFSQGYNVADLISYFKEVNEEVIIEDAIAISDGVLIVESVSVSDEYIEEQFEILYEGLLDQGLKFGGKMLQGAGKFLTGGGKKAEALGRLQSIKNAKNAKNVIPPGSAKITSDAGRTGLNLPAKVTTSGGKLQGNLWQKGVGWAKDTLGKLPGAKPLANIAKSPIGKLGGKILPGAGAALYGMDAVNRAKKGDWGGAALSGLGAVTSFGGPVAALAPAAIQMGTDALGWTGDKSKKGPAAKAAPSAPPSLKAKQDYAKSKGKYYSSSDQKTYKNYNDALAARNSRLGKSTPTPPAPSLPAAPARPAAPTPAKPAAPAAAAPAAKGPYIGTTKAGTKFVQRAATSDELKAAQAARKAGAGEEGAVKAAVERSQPTTGPATAQVDPKSVEADIKAQQERDRKKAQQQAQPVNASYEYDAYDLVLEYLLGNGHAETVDEAHYVMLEMDAQMVGNIIEASAI